MTLSLQCGVGRKILTRKLSEMVKYTYCFISQYKLESGDFLFLSYVFFIFFKSRAT